MAKKKLAVDDEVALFERFEARMRAKVAQEATLASATESEPVRVSFDRWVQKIVNRHPAEDGSRADRKAILVHQVTICDMPFEFEGKTKRMGDHPTRKLSLPLVRAWRTELQLQRRLKPGEKRIMDDGSWNRGSGRSLSPSYRDRHIATLQAMVSFTMPDVPNPIHGLEREDVTGYAREGFFEDEDHFNQWLQHACLQYQRIAQMCVSKGACRLSEARLLMAHEVTWDPEVREVYLPHGRVKNRKGKKFHLSPATYQMLEALRQTSRPCTYANCEIRQNPRKAPEHWHNHVHLFPLANKSDGRPPSKETVGEWARSASREWERAVGPEKARLGPKKERPSTHHGRHSGITWNMFISNGNTNKVMREAGITTPSIVAQYAHRAVGMVGEALAQTEVSMAEALKKKREEAEALRRAPVAAPAPRRPKRAGAR